MTITASRGARGNGRHAVANHSRAIQNVGQAERLASLVGGGVLTVYGLSRRSIGGVLLAALGGSLFYRGVTGYCSLYAALGKPSIEPHNLATSVPAGRGVKVEKSVSINRPAADLYRHWRDLENVPRFMRHIESVITQGNRSHWVARALLGFKLEWHAEIINDHPNELIAWRSLPGADVDSAGSIHFDPRGDGRETRVTVVLKYDPPAGKVGTAVAHLLGQDPEKQIEEDLRRFKQLMETGELAKTSSPGVGRISWPGGRQV